MNEVIFYISIESVCNTYGGICIMTLRNKYYWLIEDYDTNHQNIKEWTEIHKELYDQLLLLT